MRKLFDLRTPFFAPDHRRVLTMLVIFGWALVELIVGSFVFAAILAAVGAYCFYEFVVVFDPENYKDPADE